MTEPTDETPKKDQPGYGKPGRHSWKIEGKRSARNMRRQTRWPGLGARAASDREAALSEWLPPRVRATLLIDYKRERAANPPAPVQVEPDRSYRRAQLRDYTHRNRQVSTNARYSFQEVWREYQRLKLTRAA